MNINRASGPPPPMAHKLIQAGASEVYTLTGATAGYHLPVEACWPVCTAGRGFLPANPILIGGR